eukprot:m.148414 g.148414  ORF g.148414 m.148414 type:complete len:60 (+) comp14177_c3_seq1:1372-1551(+)
MMVMHFQAHAHLDTGAFFSEIGNFVKVWWLRYMFLLRCNSLSLECLFKGVDLIRTSYFR